MRRLIVLTALVPALLWACLLFTCPQAIAGVGNFCPGGGCNDSNATIVNVYWDSSSSQWDADVGGTASGETQAQIDAFTAALVHSSYFTQLTQYGVASVSVLPSVTIGACGTLPPNVDAAINNIDALILCALTHAQVTASSQVIINVFLPPQVINTGFCNPQKDGSHNAAMHGISSTFASPLYTIIPTTTACLGSASTLMVALTHEIVEALTDPDPQALSGWKVAFNGEIGDLCENLGTFPPTPFAFESTQQYWSNSANTCVVGFSPLTAPSVTSSSVCGTGRDMRFVLNGSFGPTPWDLASNQFAGQTLYLRATIARASGVLRAALRTLKTEEGDALFLVGDAMVISQAQSIVDAAKTRKLLTMFTNRSDVVGGGLASYGPSYYAVGRLAATYVHRVLLGASPADLPVERSDRFELVLNGRTAREIGLTIPPSVLVRADEVIK